MTDYTLILADEKGLTASRLTIHGETAASQLRDELQNVLVGHGVEVTVGLFPVTDPPQKCPRSRTEVDPYTPSDIPTLLKMAEQIESTQKSFNDSMWKHMNSEDYHVGGLQAGRIGRAVRDSCNRRTIQNRAERAVGYRNLVERIRKAYSE